MTTLHPTPATPDATLAALVEAVRRSPADLPRMILADWYEEHDDRPRADFVRLHCRHARSRGVGREEVEQAAAELFHAHAPDWAAEIAPPAEGIRNYRTRPHDLGWWVGPWVPDPGEELGIVLEFQRGLPDFAVCLPRLWAAIGASVLATHPIRNLVVSGETPVGRGLVNWIRDNRQTLTRLRSVNFRGRRVTSYDRAAIRGLLQGVVVGGLTLLPRPSAVYQR